MTTIIKKEKTGKFIRKFEKTPDTIYCPHFYILGFGSNACRFKCAWCFLQGTYRALIPNPVIYTNKEKMLNEIEKWIATAPEQSVLNCGELGDPVDIIDAETLTDIISLFNKTKRKVKLLFVTKSDKWKKFSSSKPSSNIIVSFSINATPVSKKWEVLAPPPGKRIDAAKQLYELGFNIRFRIDPIVPITSWKNHYSELIDRVFDNLQPEAITIGSLRYFPAVKAWAKKHNRNMDWVQFAEHKCTDSDKRYRMDAINREDVYKFVLNLLQGRCNIGICKEEVALLEKIGLTTNNKCNCLY